jgi:hypothetical protein
LTVIHELYVYSPICGALPGRSLLRGFRNAEAAVLNMIKDHAELPPMAPDLIFDDTQGKVIA